MLELCSSHVPIFRLNPRGGLRVDRTHCHLGSGVLRVPCAQPGMEHINSFMVLVQPGISTQQRQGPAPDPKEMHR